MKKLIFIVPLMLLFLVGCSDNSKSGVITCTLSSNNVVNGYQLQSTYKINYTGKHIESVDTEEIIITDSDDILNYFETTLNDTYKKTNDAYGGYTYTVTKEAGRVTSKVTIDYNEMNLNQFVNDQPTLKTYVEDGKMLVDGIKNLYTSMGATCSE